MHLLLTDETNLPEDPRARVVAGRYIEWFQWASVSSLTMATAVGFALWSMVATIAVPPRESDTPEAIRQYLPEVERPILHMAALALGVILICGFMTFLARRRDRLSGTEIVYRIGFLGIAISGLIGISVSLPYSWQRLANKPSPVGAWLPMVSYIILVRIAFFPLVGAFASLVAHRLVRWVGGRR